MDEVLKNSLLQQNQFNGVAPGDHSSMDAAGGSAERQVWRYCTEPVAGKQPPKRMLARQVPFGQGLLPTHCCHPGHAALSNFTDDIELLGI
jgi:hypothetical protein